MWGDVARKVSGMSPRYDAQTIGSRKSSCATTLNAATIDRAIATGAYYRHKSPPRLEYVFRAEYKLCRPAIK
jgi:hypothetical protein